MSLPTVNPEALPPISARTRSWIYATLFLLVLAANAIDLFFDPEDVGIPIAEPWWLPGSLRVLGLLSAAGNIIALANVRPTPAEVVAKAGRDGTAVPLTYIDTPPPQQPDLGQPDGMPPRPVTARAPDDPLGD